MASQPILEDGLYKFKDVTVVLKSQYFVFENNITKLVNNDISQNQLFKLNDNQYNWLPLVKSLEPNDIPILLPKDIKLADGNYGKNFTRLLISKSNLNNVMNIYGKGLEALLSNFRWFEEINKLDITKQCKFFLEKEIINFKRLELSFNFVENSW